MIEEIYGGPLVPTEIVTRTEKCAHCLTDTIVVTNIPVATCIDRGAGRCLDHAVVSPRHLPVSSCSICA